MKEIERDPVSLYVHPPQDALPTLLADPDNFLNSSERVERQGEHS